MGWMSINTSVLTGKLKVINFSLCQKNFGETIGLNQVDKLDRIFKDKHKRLLCVNDDGNFNKENLIHFKQILNEYYPKKSAYEK